MSTTITLSVNANALHNDKENPLSYISFTDDKGDTYDDPNDKTTFDTILDSSDTVIWKAEDSDSGNGLSITAITIDSAPEGFFSTSPNAQSDGSWKAVVGDNSTKNNLVCEYTITFDDGFVGDAKVPIDPKLQIRKKEVGNN